MTAARKLHQASPQRLAERRGTIRCKAPFDFSLSLKFLDGFSPMRGDQTVTDGSLIKAVFHGGQPVAFELRSEGTPEHPSLTYRLLSTRALTENEAHALVERISFFVSADEDLAPFHALASRDAPFARLADKLRGLHHVKFISPFECACWGTLFQRISLSQARAMKEAVMREVGASIEVDGRSHPAFPEPKALLAFGEKALVGLVRNERKAKTLTALAKAFATVDEGFLRGGPLKDVEAWLLDIYGVGEFTSGFVLYRGLGRFLRQPVSDRLLAAASEVYGRTVTRLELDRMGQGYGDWSGQWALYLWASTWF